MDNSATEITFDSEGVCNFCNQYKKQAEGLRESGEFYKMIQKLKEGGCVIGLSGGMDSSMVAYILRTSGVKPIVVSFDNHWNSEKADENIKRIVKKYNDWTLITYKIDFDEFLDLQHSFVKAGVRNIEIPTDHAITALLYKVANEYDCKYIATGGNVVTEAIMPESWGYYAQDLKYIKGIHKRFGSVPLRSFPTMSLRDWLYYTFVKRIKTLPALDYIDYNKEVAEDILKHEFGFEPYGEKHWESDFTKWFQTFYLPSKFGIDKRKAHYSTLINSGQMTRRQALEMLKDRPEPPMIVEKFRLNKINVDDKKTYRDYPNNSWIFKEDSPARSIIRRIYRTFVKV